MYTRTSVSTEHTGAARSSPCVALVGPLPERLQRRAASLAGWSLRKLSTVQALLDVVSDGAPQLLVVSLALTSAECMSVMDFAAKHAPYLCIGFVVGHHADALHDMLERFDRCRFDGSHTGPSGSVAFVDDTVLDGHLPNVVDAKAIARSPEQQAELFLRGADVVYLRGHSNSQCQAAGPGLALCSRDNVPLPPSAKVLPCFAGGPCRFDPRERLRVSAMRLNARILVNFTCFGHYFATAPYSPETSVSRGLWRSETLRAMVTTLSPAHFTEADFLTTYYLVNAGQPMGIVANTLNVERIRRGERPSLACIGDPSQQLSKALVLAEAEASGDSVHLRRPKNLVGACDLQLGLPHWSGGDHVVAIEAGAVLAGLLLSDGTLYVSFDAKTDQISLRRIPIEQARERLTLDSLLPALDTVRLFVQGLVRLLQRRDGLPAQVADDLRHAIAARETLEDAVRRSLPLSIVPGQVLSTESLFVFRDFAFEAMQRLVIAMSMIYEKILPQRGTAFSLLEPYLCPIGSEVTADHCAYCGSTVVETRRSTSDGRVAQIFGNCDNCGTLYQDGAHAKWIDVPSPVAAGTRVEVRVEVRNPFPFPVPAGGAVAFQSFCGGEGATARFPSVDLDAHASAVLATELTIPQLDAPGIQRLVVGTIIGCVLSHCRRDIEVESSADVPSKAG